MNGNDLARRITDLKGRARTDGMSDDPAVRAAFFDEKAAVFESVAASYTWQANEAIVMAENARAEAAAIRLAIADDGGAS